VNELSRIRAMIGVGLVAELAQGKLAIRGHDPSHSLELEVVDVLSDALEFLRPMLELEEVTYVAK
jgi:hypothetical protein